VLQFETRSDEETREVGRAVAQKLPASALVLLSGELGAGKTTLVKGIVDGLGIAGADDVSSPTYTIVHEYGEPVRVYHVDLYRLDTEEEVRGFGFEELLDRRALVLVEWGERFPQLLPRERIEITIDATGESSRRITVRGLSSDSAASSIGGT
jgi:tRNA threonylcarbamoyladenosine biosynthesis protein TsaE